ncbi:MAG TPA: sialidase family protein [Candidatus Dormibacteraeota bacterium]|nr:sialidase family protein [Candidatus Dormibacteraeota bacterium]
MAKRVALLVGTRKGLFVLDGHEDRDDWAVRGPLCEGWPIHDAILDPASGAIMAAGGSNWYGPAVWRSDDLGETWTHSSEGLTYGDDAEKVTTIWNLASGRDVIYAGVEPAGLFRSRDGGATWQHVEGLTNHPSRPEWQPGNGGLILHSIVPSPTDADRVWVGISSVGAFETQDGGATWETRNKGVRAGFQPDVYPEFGQCVHKLVMAADGGEHLYQQNHCGVYRSSDGGRQWEEITAGLPTEFGFPMGAHPRDPKTVWTIPLTLPEDGRLMPEGHAAVWRTNDGGDSWVRSDDGLPTHDAYVAVLREAMAVDRLDPVGVYFGTSTGQVYGSRDEGRSWSLVADNLPAIWSVEAAVID